MDDESSLWVGGDGKGEGGAARSGGDAKMGDTLADELIDHPEGLFTRLCTIL